jgi:hypothetical protein
MSLFVLWVLTRRVRVTWPPELTFWRLMSVLVVGSLWNWLFGWPEWDTFPKFLVYCALPVFTVLVISVRRSSIRDERKANDSDSDQLDPQGHQQPLDRDEDDVVSDV